MPATTCWWAGLGIDTVSYANATSGANGQGVTVNLALTTAQNTIRAGTDTLSGFENLTGSEFNDTLTGTTAANVLTGLGGNDILNGGAGADWMLGGTGNDTYVVDNVGDVVTELDGEGSDTIQSSISFSLAGLAFVENLTLTGTAALSGTGNALDNIIIGNSGANVLTGLDGADTLNGGTGADQMFGGLATTLTWSTMWAMWSTRLMGMGQIRFCRRSASALSTLCTPLAASRT